MEQHGALSTNREPKGQSRSRLGQAGRPVRVPSHEAGRPPRAEGLRPRLRPAPGLREFEPEASRPRPQSRSEGAHRPRAAAFDTAPVETCTQSLPSAPYPEPGLALVFPRRRRRSRRRGFPARASPSEQTLGAQETCADIARVVRPVQPSQRLGMRPDPRRCPQRDSNPRYHLERVAT
jgi:hypothetical protein